MRQTKVWMDGGAKIAGLRESSDGRLLAGVTVEPEQGKKRTRFDLLFPLDDEDERLKDPCMIGRSLEACAL